MTKELTEFDSDPYSLFIFAINSALTKQKSIPRLAKFFEFIGISGSMREKCSTFAKKAKDQPSWARLDNRAEKLLRTNNEIKFLYLYYCEISPLYKETRISNLN